MVQVSSKQRTLCGKKTKKPKGKRAGGVAQVTECLPSKYKALSSKPNTTKKKKKLVDLVILLMDV
jgi:hypothetical protein